jgi:1-acyl-sn-glycerol-3-phosphate acyltransferase
MTSTESAIASSTSELSRDRGVIAIVHDLVVELQPRPGQAIAVSRTSRLDRDLGIDSLSRAELILRLEHAFRIRMPPRVIAEAETVGDLLAAVAQSRPLRGPVRIARPELPSLPQVSAPVEARTLLEFLDWHVERHADRLHVTVLEDENTVLGTLTYGELARQARDLAAGLIAKDIVPGDRIALMLPTGIDFFVAFFGVLYAGGVPVPIYPPARLSIIEEHMHRQAGILRNAGTRILITVPQVLRFSPFLRGQIESLNLVETVAELRKLTASVQLPSTVDPGATAFIQYTSGSTGDPKGVVLSHANLLANIRSIGSVINATSSDVFVSWLPLYHDLGLIGGWLGCLYFGARFYVMSPLSFLRRPESWLWVIHRYRGTLSAAPNFAYELCLNKIREEDAEGLDLSCLRMVANGAEPISVQTLRRFIARFERYGFKPDAMAPAYGLAENTVGLTFPPAARAPLIDRVDREALSRSGIAEPARPDDPRPLEMVACGQPLPGHDVRIVDTLGRELGERHEGRLEFRGPSATSGYFRNESKTRALFHDGWLDSGDQAYLAGGEAYITGRVKDIIIRAGRHIYPQEIEEAVTEIPGVIANGVAVFGITDTSSGTERTVIMAETLEADPARRAALQAKAREVATDILGAPPDEVVLAPPQTVPKTSSGKIRRSAAREIFEAGRIYERRPTLRWQIVRLTFAGAALHVWQKVRSARTVAYAGWWWTVIACVSVAAWFAVMGGPNLRLRWTIVRALARAALAALGVPVSVTGLDRVPRGNAILVFNHSSYADALVLAAVLPGTPAFAAKAELARQLFAGPFLRRLGAAFVERYDVAGSLADASALTEIARQGRVVTFFPEGTFTRRAGLTGFYLGAFKVASEAGLPVVPGVIRGTRTMLRGDQWFPRWAAIDVSFAEPITSRGRDFAAAVDLRDRARQAILARCGEPDLGGLAKPLPAQAAE